MSGEQAKSDGSSLKVADWMAQIHREFAEGLIAGGDSKET